MSAAFKASLSSPAAGTTVPQGWRQSRWQGVGARLALGFGLTALLIVALAVGSWLAVDRQGARFTQTLDQRLPRLELLQSVHQSVVDLQIASMDALLHDAPASTERALKAIQAGRTEVGGRVESLQALFKDDGEAGEKAAEAFATHSSGVLVGLVKFSRLVQSGNREAATTFIDQGLRPKLEGLAKVVADYRIEQMKILANERIEAEATTVRTRLSIGTSVVIALLISGVSGWLITRSVVRPLADARRLGDAIAGGDLTLRIDTARRDESAALLQSMNRMSADLAGIVSRVREGCDAIAAGIVELASGNADLSRRTELQASGLQETASVTNQLDRAVTDNAVIARDASRLAGDALAVAGQGGEAVGKLAATMRDIADESKHIVGIVGIIDSIAFQTNILALNAAVEAARAGEQGRGFAVVASEVRNLAQRSAQAAREIKGLIDTSVGRIEGGARAADDAGRTVGAVLDAVGQVNALMQQIAQASQQQAGDVSQVSMAVAKIDEATQQNAALVEQVAAASEAMRHQAEQVVETVALFRV